MNELSENYYNSESELTIESLLKNVLEYFKKNICMKFYLVVLYNCEKSSETELEMFAEETEYF